MSLESLCGTHEVVVQRRTVSTGSAMQRVHSWSNVGAMTCRVVPLSSARVSEYAQRGFRVSHGLYTVSEPPGVGAEYRFVMAGRIFEFVSMRNPDELDRYWIVLVDERTTHPDRA